MTAVVIQLPPDAGNGLQIAVTDTDGKVDVLVRAASHHRWERLDHIEGKFEVRP